MALHPAQSSHSNPGKAISTARRRFPKRKIGLQPAPTRGRKRRTMLSDEGSVRV